MVTEGKGTATATPESGEDGTVVTLTATPGEGYRFVHWVRWAGMLSGGLEIPSAESATTAFVITGFNVTVAAVFEPLPPEESEPEISEPEASEPENSEDSTPVSDVSETEVSAESEDPFCEGEESGDAAPVGDESDGGGTNVALIIVSVIAGLALAAGAVFAFLFFRNKKLDTKS